MVNVLLIRKYCVSLWKWKSNACGMRQYVWKHLLTNALACRPFVHPHFWLCLLSHASTQWKWTFMSRNTFFTVHVIQKIDGIIHFSCVNNIKQQATTETHFSIFYKWIFSLVHVHVQTHIRKNITFQLINWYILTQSIFESWEKLYDAEFSHSTVICKVALLKL